MLDLLQTVEQYFGVGGGQVVVLEVAKSTPDVSTVAMCL